jgi:iron-sulfur cluster repair protein YtfE (RIC family)
MLQIGQRHAEDLVGTLLACHDRIRRFTSLAYRIATEPASDDDVRAAAAQVARYFREALPHHVADEDMLAVALASSGGEVQAALATMAAEHAEHDAAVTTLVELCDTLAAQPTRRPELASSLARVASELDAAFDQHLGAEERIVFPAIAQLPTATQDELRAAMRRRREDGAPGAASSSSRG